MSLLKSALRQARDYDFEKELNYHILKDMLINKFQNTNVEIAKSDCIRFINNADELSFWSKELFIDLTNDYFKKY